MTADKRDLLLGGGGTAILLTLAFTAPSAVIWVVALALAGVVFGSALLSPFFGLAALLFVTAFQTFIDFYLPHTGNVFAGAMLRDGLLITVFMRWAIGRYLLIRQRAPLSLGEQLAIGYMVLLAFWIPAAPVLVAGVTGYRNLAGFVVLLLVAADHGLSSRQRWLLVEVFFVIVLVFGAIGIAESVTNRGIFNPIGYDVRRVLGSDLPWDIAWQNQFVPRATGGTGNPLEFGFYMAVAATLAFGCLTGKAPIRRSLLLLVATVASAAAVLTFARSAVACLIVGLTSLACILRLRRAWLWSLILVVAGIVTMYSPAGKALSDRFTFQDQAGFATAQSRLNIWQEVISSGFSLTGSGLGTQGAAAGRSVQVTKYIITDNYYGGILLQVGAIPVTIFVVFVTVLGLSFLKCFRFPFSYEGRALAATGLVLIVMLVIGASVSSTLESRAVSTEMWTLLGIILGQTRFRPSGVPVYGRARTLAATRGAAISTAAAGTR